MANNRRISIKLLKENQLKEEYFSFFWMRFGFTLIIGLIMWLTTFLIPSLNDETIKMVLNAGVTYLLSSEILRRMINSNKSALEMVFNEKNKKVINSLDMLKVYWSFFWREFLIQIGAIIIISLFSSIILSNVGFNGFIPVMIILGLLLLVISYYIGRYVFKYVITSVWWQIGRIEIEIES